MTQSPRIHRIEWGKIEVDGLEPGRDMKLWPGGGREWNWQETGTHHVPGIQAADVKELVEHDAQVIVLSRGMELRLQTCPEILAFLRERNVAYHVEEANDAMTLYNELAK